VKICLTIFVDVAQKSMSNRRMRNGIGANCSVLKRFLHSRPIVDAKYPNATQSERLEPLLAIRREKKTVNHKEQWCIIFRHDDFENIELYAAERYCKVVEEGPFESLFVQGENVAEAGPGGLTVEEGAPPTATPFLSLNGRDDIARFRAMNFDVDDDNEPAPENIPTANGPPPGEPSGMYKEWGGGSGIDHRRAAGHRFERAKIIGANGNDSRISLFLLFLPRHFIESVLLPATNQEIEGIDLHQQSPSLVSRQVSPSSTDVGGV